MLTSRPEDEKQARSYNLDEGNTALLGNEIVPYRLPSFVKPSALNNHVFEVNGEVYEFIDGQYFKRVSILEQGSSFGEIALQRRCLRTASVKTDSDVLVAFLTKAQYEASVMKIADEVEQDMVDFLLNIPMFKGLSRKKVLSFYWELHKAKYQQGQVVYAETESIDFVYIVYKGQFALDKHLPHEDRRKQARLQLKKGEEKQKVDNILTKKFPDMKDFPQTQKISIFQKNSLIG